MSVDAPYDIPVDNKEKNLFMFGIKLGDMILRFKKYNHLNKSNLSDSRKDGRAKLLSYDFVQRHRNNKAFACQQNDRLYNIKLDM